MRRPVGLIALLGLGVSTLVAIGATPSRAATAAVTYAWGSNQRGQLGDGTAENRSSPVPGGVPGARAVAGGLAHSLAIAPDDTAWAWGSNANGQLGVGGTILGSATPLPVSGLTDVVAVAGGNDHSLALTSDGAVWAWGDDHQGQIGDGTPVGAHFAPVSVEGLAGVVAVAAGTWHSVALEADGTVWAWGDNLHGQLGDGTTIDRASAAHVAGLSGIIAIAAGGFHSLALASDGTVWAWGEGDRGQLGDGLFSPRSLPVRASGLAGVVGVAAGAYHSMAVDTDGTVWTWGNNGFGQLGRTGGSLGVPAPVPGLAGVTAVAANASNGFHSLARRSDGTVWAWGWNGAGQLGDGTTTNRSAPVQVSGLSDVTLIAAGGHHSLAVVNPNSPPVADDVSVSTRENTPVPITLSASDADGDPLTFAVADGPANGTLSGTAPDLLYTPNAGFDGVDGFTYVASDGSDESTPAIVSITVVANTRPTADDLTISTDEDTPVAVTLSGQDADGDPLSFAVADGPANGTLSGTAPDLLYTPNPGFHGLDAFTYTASDGTDESAPATVTITVVRANTPPAAADLAVTTNEGAPVAVTLSGHDADGDPLTFVVSDAPSNGSLSGTSPNLVYTPSTGFAGVDTFTYVALDGTDASAPATVTVTVRAATTIVARPIQLHLQLGAPWLAIRFTARLTTTRDGKPVAGEPVVMTVDDQTACAATAGPDGTASCVGPVRLLGAVAARGYVASYAGSEAYQPSTARSGLR